MSKKHRDRHDARAREARIDALKQQAARAAGDKMVAWESDTLPPELREQFWRHVVEFEEAPSTTLFKELTEAGLELPEPAALDDAALTSKLQDVIGALAGMRVFISQTNHLSDRELYTHLWQEVLPDETTMVTDDPGSAWHVDLLGSGGEAETHLYLKHYASEEDRRHWLADFPDYDMPAHEDPAYDRDRHLPQPGW